MDVFVWTEERKSELKPMVDAGMSYKDIGDYFGVSRNAISGAVNRHCPRPKSERLNRVIANPKISAQRARKRERTDNYKPKPPYLDVKLPEQPTSKNPRKIWKLKDGQCRFPISGERDETLFCADRAVKGYPYCACHCRRAYSSAAQWERENADAIEVEADAPLESKPVRDAA